MNPSLVATRFAIQILSRLAPEVAGLLGRRWFFTPPAPRPSARITQLLAGSERSFIQVENQPLAVWQWGHGPRVLLVHGWAGVGGQLAAFAPALVEQGLSVVTFDAPAHGESPGRESSIMHFATAITAIAEQLGPVRAIIAHSFGAPASSLAVARGLSVDAMSFIGAPTRPGDWAEQFAREIGLTDEAFRRMRRNAQERFCLGWNDADPIALAPQMRVPLLIVHDREDADVPIEHGQALAKVWPGAQLLTTTGLGHRRVLGDPDVIRNVTAFFVEKLAERSFTRRATPREDRDQRHGAPVATLP